MGPDFLEFQPDAELLIWAGDGGELTIEALPFAELPAFLR